MGRRVESKAINDGRNAENAKLRDDRYVRCGRCGFICHLDRDSRSPYGSKAGMGISHDEVETIDSEDLDFDSTYGMDGYYQEFTITGGCPQCGAYTYDQEEYRG